MTKFIGIDAGTVSGYAELTYNREVPEVSEFQTTDELVFHMQKEMMKGSPLVIFYEKFVISQRTIKTEVVYDTLLFNGWLHHEGRRMAYVETIGYTPAQSKAFSTDDKLKALGWHNPTPGGHQNDAARVLLLGLAKRGDARVINGLKAML